MERPTPAPTRFGLYEAIAEELQLSAERAVINIKSSSAILNADNGIHEITLFSTPSTISDQPGEIWHMVKIKNHLEDDETLYLANARGQVLVKETGWAAMLDPHRLADLEMINRVKYAISLVEYEDFSDLT